MSDDSLVTIMKFFDAMSAHAARGRLESEGILAFIQDDNVGAVMPDILRVIGGIRLQVRKADVERAMEILDEGFDVEILTQEGESFNHPRESTYRVKGTKAGLYSAVGIICSVMLLSAVPLPLGGAIAVLFGVFLLAQLVGRFSPMYRCATCMINLPGRVPVCPGCKREFRGDVGTLQESRKKESQRSSGR